jgi:hypothetical protein
MWQELQNLIARVDALEKRDLKENRTPELAELLARLDKWELIINKYTAPKR